MSRSISLTSPTAELARNPIWIALRRAWISQQLESEARFSASVQYLVKANLPGVTEAESEWKKLLEQARKLEGLSGTSLLLPLTHDEQRRRRYRGGISKEFEGLGPRYGPALTLGLSLLPPAVVRGIRLVLAEIGAYSSVTFEELQGKLRLLSEYAKKYGQLRWGASWQFYHGLDIQSGYLEAKPIEDFVDDIKEWSEVESKIAVPESLFRLGLRDCLHQGNYDENGISLTDWAKEYNWPRAGSSDGPRLPVIVDGIERKARKSKNASALAMTPEEVVARVLGWEPQNNKAVQKRELGKVRAVVAGDLNLYLRMSYIDSWLFKGMAGSRWSTLFYTPEQFNRLWTGLGDFSRPSVRVPLDQSKFDHQVSKKMVLVMIDEIRILITERVFGTWRAEMLGVMDRIRYSVERGGTWVGKHFVKYKNGVMSGWKWTALFDSLANWAELFVARRWVEQKRGGGDILREGVVQGDDSRVVVETTADALALIYAYQEMNIVINPKKFFVSTTRDEYLRKVGEGGVTHGYFWRAIPSLFWRNPISKDPPVGEKRAREQLTGWMTLVGRGASLEPVLKRMRKDIIAGNHIEEEVYEGWLNLASSLGGAGLGMRTEGYTILPSIRKPKNVHLGKAPGVDYLARTLSIPRSDLAQAVLERVELPAQTEYEVEAPSRAEYVKFEYGRPRFGTHDSHLHPKWRKEIPVWIQGTLVSILIRSKEFGRIEQLLEHESALFFNDLRSRSSRGVWLSWLEGKLPSGLPTIPGWSPAYISAEGGRVIAQELKNALALSRVRRVDLQRAAYYAEVKIRDRFRTFDGVRVAD